MIPRHSGIISRHVIVEITADNGKTGIGEMSDFGHLPRYVPDVADLEKQLNGRLNGLDPMQRFLISGLMKEMYPEQMYIYDMGSVIRCGIDIALHDLIARELGKHTGLPVIDACLVRQRHSSPQARTGSAAERRHNVENAFTCCNERAKGRQVLLIDDVSTSGATLSACAAALKEAGSASVWGLTIAREI